MNVLEDFVSRVLRNQEVLVVEKSSYDWQFKLPAAGCAAFYIILSGKCWLGLKNKSEVVVLKAGDLVFVSKNVEHVIFSGYDMDRSECGRPDLSRIEDESFDHKMLFVTGVIQLDYHFLHPMFEDFPNYYKASEEENMNTRSQKILLDLLNFELVKDKKNIGSIVLHNLIVILFYYLVKDFQLQMVSKGKSLLVKKWIGAYADKFLGEAIKQIHNAPEQKWTVESMARKTGLSRSAFACRFKEFTGDTPMNYLSTIRIQKSIEYLKFDRVDIERIAERVGYSSAFAFSKAFKRICGIPPKEYRKRFNKC